MQPNTNQQVCKTIGVTLFLAAGLLAVLIAVAFSFTSPPGVGAHDCDDNKLPVDLSTSTPTTTPDVHCRADGHDALANHAALSSTEPGAQNVAIRLTATAEASIGADKEITVDFSGPSADSGFTVPTSIDKAQIQINDTALMAEVVVNGERVTLTVPTGVDPSITAGSDYRITFAKAAGIRNPYYAGNRPIVVSSNATGDDPDRITAVIERSTTITPSEGARGSTFILIGAGYPKGTVTIFDGDDEIVGPVEILDTLETTNGGFESIDLRVRGELGIREYTVRTKDSEGAVHSATFRITQHTTTFTPATALIGQPLRINIADWQHRDKGVAAVRIAGEDAYVTEVVEYDNCIDYTGRSLANENRVLSLTVDVPASILEGMQTVSLYDYDQLELSGTDNDDSNNEPCTNETGRDGVGNVVTATLPPNATPIIKETVEIVVVSTVAPTPPSLTIRPRNELGQSVLHNEVQRNNTFDLVGEHFPIGTVTIFDGDDNVIDNASEIIASDEVDATKRFTISGLRFSGEPGNLEYKVWAIDSEGRTTGPAIFRITKHTTTFSPTAAVAGSRLRITISDWQHGDTGIAAVRIAGKAAPFIGELVGVAEYRIQGSNDTCYEYTGLKESNNVKAVSFEVMVPVGTLRGMQTVSIYDEDQLEVTGALQSSSGPCQPSQKGELEESNATVGLKGNAMPTIQEIVEVLSEPPLVVPRGPNVIEADGGRDRKLEFHTSPPSAGSYLDAGDQIAITLPQFVLPETAVLNMPDNRAFIKLSVGGGARGDAPPNLVNAPSPTRVESNSSTDKLTLTLPAGVSVDSGAGEYLIITIQPGTGILTPEIPRGFDDPAHPNDPGEGYPVGIALIDTGLTPPRRIEATDDNIVVVRNPLSSTIPSDPVQVVLATHAEAELRTGDEITVDFSGPSADSEFVVPSSISTSRIRIDPEEATGITIPFSPSGVLVQGRKVILTIPAIPSGASAGGEISWTGNYTITFQQLAGIKNPFAAGIRDIKVSSFVQGDVEDVIKAVIRRTTTIDTEEGPRGIQFILQGKGYAPGTVTVYHDANGNEQIDAGETLDSATTVRGAFSVDLVVRGEPGDSEYRVRTRDSEGAEDEVIFRITSGVFFEPAPARVGSPLQITISDWHDDYPDVVAAVSIAGQQAYVPEVIEYQNCFDYVRVFRANSYGVLSLEVIVPRFVPGGKQTVALHGREELTYIDGNGNPVSEREPCSEVPSRGARTGRHVTAQLGDEPSAIIKATVEIDTEDLLLTPSSAARGQKVTITGSGFTRSPRGRDHIASVWIGGKRVVDDHSELEVGSAGDFAFTVTVPLDLTDGQHEVLMEGNDTTLGRATLTIPEAVIVLDPAEGPRGTELKVTGSGFIAKEIVLVNYGPETGASIEATSLWATGDLADAQGDFELAFKVPVTAEVGRGYKVTAVAKVDILGGRTTVDAETIHFVPKAVITVAPASVSPGDYLTVSALNLPPFTLVGPIKIAGIGIVTTAEIATDETGSFETEVLIPAIDFGDHTLLVQVAGAIVPRIIKVAPPPLSGPPGEVFKYLIRDEVLSIVWHYDNATQSWSLFDPLLAEEMAELNDLAYVSSGDIVWVNMIEPRFFQEVSLKSGWNLVRLK